MRMFEFKSIWINDYDDDEEKEIRAVHGDEERNWPKKISYGPILLDIEKFTRANPSLRYKNGITIKMKSGELHMIQMPWTDFKDLLYAEGLINLDTCNQKIKLDPNEPTS